jgi:hypothetical protein
MSKGVLIFAHNSREVDYSILALISGGLAKKYLKVPASVVTDESTMEWVRSSGNEKKFKETFENIILVDRPSTANVRRLNDGGESKMVPFINSSRTTAYDISPYDRTLLIDSDFLIFSDQLSSYWDLDYDVMISESINDMQGDRVGHLDITVSETGTHLYWATCVMFSKSDYSKTFFDLVQHVQENYKHYGSIFKFSTEQYRNDIAFSVAKHIMDGFETDTTSSLPPLLTTIDRDMLIDVKENKLVFLIHKQQEWNAFYPAVTINRDVHIMNKQSIVRNKDLLLGLL